MLRLQSNVCPVMLVHIRFLERPFAINALVAHGLQELVLQTRNNALNVCMVHGHRFLARAHLQIVLSVMQAFGPLI